jgi:hypothetical protein
MPSRGRRRALGVAAAVTVGLIGAYASTTGAQTTSDPIVVELVSVDDKGTSQLLPADVTQAMSDTGAVVAYEVSTPDGRRVWIRDRVGDTSRPVAEIDSAAPGISGNGCVVAYSAPRELGIALTVVDRCATAAPAALPVGAVVDVVDGQAVPEGGVTTPSAPALSFDGSTIVWSTGTEIRRYVRTAPDGALQLADAFAPVSDTPGIVTGADVDVSADGTTIVFVAGPGDVPYTPAPANVYVWSSLTPDIDPEPISTTPSGDPGLSDSSSPTITADGSFVVFESTSLDLAVVGGATPIVPFVVGVDMVAGTAQILVDDATRPTVSADGNHVVYQRGDAVRVLSSDATATTDEDIAELAAAKPVGRLSISQHGRWLVFATATDLAAEPLDPAALLDATQPAESEPTPSVWAADRRSSWPEVVDTTTTTTTTTTVPTTPPTTAPTTPTTPTTSTGQDVGVQPTVPATTLAPAPVVPRFPSTGTSFPTVTSTVPRRTSSTTTSRTFQPPVFEASPFASPVAFEPTVANAGRRTAPVTLTNATTSTLRVSSVTVDGTGGFSLVTDACSGIAIARAASCSVEVQFSPIAVGPAAGSVTFQLDDGTVVTAALSGEGVAAPTLDLVPAVAGAGQTVTVFGTGFPAGSTVELMQPGVAFPEPVIVDADGTFAHVVVVLPQTPTGPTSLTVNGQPDVFGDVSAELLVSTRGRASTDAALRSGAIGR